MKTDPDLLKQLASVVKLPIHPSKFPVFVLGPSLHPAKVVKKPSTPIGKGNHDAVVTHARYLRYKTKKALEQDDFPVIFGEAQDWLNFCETHYKASDLGSAEYNLARNSCGAVVIYPSSVGSISELGLFTKFDRITEKMLAIVHSGYAKDSSFFRKALLRIFKQERGCYEFFDYTDHDACVSAAVEFVKDKFQKATRDEYTFQDVISKKVGARGTIQQIFSTSPS